MAQGNVKSKPSCYDFQHGVIFRITQTVIMVMFTSSLIRGIIAQACLFTQKEVFFKIFTKCDDFKAEIQFLHK